MRTEKNTWLLGERKIAVASTIFVVGKNFNDSLIFFASMVPFTVHFYSSFNFGFSITKLSFSRES